VLGVVELGEGYPVLVSYYKEWVQIEEWNTGNWGSSVKKGDEINDGYRCMVCTGSRDVVGNFTKEDIW